MGKYKVVNGTSYDSRTSDEVINLLERYRSNRQRIRIFYGSEGKCHNDEYDTIGTVGRSTGTCKIPLLIKNSRSYGGESILDNYIVRIDIKEKGKIKTVYVDKNTEFDHFISTDIGSVYNETKDELYAKCKNGDSGKRLAAFINGERWSK